MWEHIQDGDGGDCGVNQLNPNEVYHSFYYVSLERSNNKGNSWTSLAPPNVASLFYPPVEVSGATVAIGGVSFVVTRTNGASWTNVSLGLPSGDGASAMRAVDANTFLVGTTKGRMLRVSWNGTTWLVKNLTSPAPRYISCIAIDPSNAMRIWVTLSQLGGGRVFRSDDAGATWVGLHGRAALDSHQLRRRRSRELQARMGGGRRRCLSRRSSLGSSWSSFSAGLAQRASRRPVVSQTGSDAVLRHPKPRRLGDQYSLRACAWLDRACPDMSSTGARTQKGK